MNITLYYLYLYEYGYFILGNCENMQRPVELTEEIK